MTVGGALLVALVLAVFAYVIHDNQVKDREDVEQRFEDVAKVSGAVTSGIFEFSLASSGTQAANRFADRRVDVPELEAFAERGQLVYAIVIGPDGKRLAATSRAPAVADRSEAIELALRDMKPRFSNVLEGDVVQSVVPYATPFGERVYVQGTPLKSFSDFLAGFLGDLPNFADAESVMIDADAVVLGGANSTAPVGERLADQALIAALADAAQGEYGDERYFASAAVASSPLRIVIDTSKDRLYESIGGSRRAVPWILFGAFGLVALAGLVLLRRAVLAGAELQRKHLSEQHAVEINDNIIQGLALAKYQLQAGAGEASESQVSQTLREAQRLVSNLLGDAEVQAGQLRREGAAETTHPDPSEKENP